MLRHKNLMITYDTNSNLNFWREPNWFYCLDRFIKKRRIKYRNICGDKCRKVKRTFWFEYKFYDDDDMKSPSQLRYMENFLLIIIIVCIRMDVESSKNTNSSEEFLIMGKRCNLKSNCSIVEEKKNGDESKRKLLNDPAISDGNIIKKMFKIMLEGKVITF